VTTLAEHAHRALGRVSGAFLGQLLTLVELQDGLRRYVLGELMFMVAETLQTLADDNRGTPMLLGEYLRQRELAAEEIAEQINGLMGDEDAATLARQLTPLVSDLGSALGQTGLPNTVATRLGVLRLIDYLRANTIQLTDLAIDVTGVAEPAAMAEGVRSLAGVLPDRFPGRSIEIRVPPHIAVQIGFGDGPTHTRGTPGNVVEMNPDTFWTLATARQSWRRAAESGSLRFSGVHAEQAERAFPIYRSR
jgi:hypothetical protein